MLQIGQSIPKSAFNFSLGYSLIALKTYVPRHICSNISHSALFPLRVRWPSDQPGSCVVLLRWRSEEWRSVAAPLMRFLSNEDLCLNIIARHYCQPDARRQRYARCGARCTQSGLIITLGYSASFYFIQVFMSRCLMLVNRDITTFIANPWSQALSVTPQTTIHYNKMKASLYQTKIL